jgi:hypothetical protein
VRDYSEGLSTLLSPSSRPDATVLQRSAIAVRSRCTQLMSSVGGRTAADLFRAKPAFSGGVQKTQHSTTVVGGSSSTIHLLKRKIEQSGLVGLKTASLGTAATRRNLSSGPTWRDRWNQLKKAVSGPNKQPKAKSTEGAGGAATVGLKSGAKLATLSEATNSVRSTFGRYREAVGLQVEAFWRRNWYIVVGVVGLGVCLLLWRLMFGVASTFISMSEGLAKFGFLALAAAMVIVGVSFASHESMNNVALSV